MKTGRMGTKVGTKCSIFGFGKASVAHIADAAVVARKCDIRPMPGQRQCFRTLGVTDSRILNGSG